MKVQCCQSCQEADSCSRLMKSPGFKSGRKAFRSKNRDEWENPYDPDDQNYEDFWDGIVYEKERAGEVAR